MAIDVNKIKWADTTEVDPVSGLPNKSEPPEELKISGVKREQNLTRQHFNYLADQYHEMFADIQQQINDLTVSAGVGTLQTVFPVGSYWFNGSSSADPSVSLGFGTWVRVLGKFIVGVDEGDTTWDAGLKTGGAKNHTHTATTASAGSHNHTSVTGSTVAPLPTHTHRIYATQGTVGHPGSAGVTAFADTTNVAVAGDEDITPKIYITNNGNGTQLIENSGTGGTHNHSISSDGSHTHTVTVANASNVPPFEAAFVWRRTA